MTDTISSRTVHIELGERSYPIHIGTGLLGSDIFSQLSNATSAVLVTNETVAPLYADRVLDALSQRFGKAHRVVLPDGEQYKNWEVLQKIFDALLGLQCDRKAMLFALGGGVIGDMTGFAAACFMRGVPFVQLPTTLLSQVDSSVGGKTGINHPLGKNMIGAFHQPQMVVCDIESLKTLPEREFSAGLAEVIKYGPIADLAFLDWLEANMAALRARDASALTHAIQRCCEIKAAVVGKDERESGLRAILNFGHTFGHAIEAGLGYGQWLHGEAVASGMVMAAELSRSLGMIDTAYVSRLRDLIEAAGLPVRGPLLGDNNPQRYLELMRMDKKSEAGAIRFVVIHADGQASMRSAADALVSDVIDRCC